MRVSCHAIAVGVLAFCFCSDAFALQNFTGRVTSVEVTYMPESVKFSMDAGNAACPVGSALIWRNSNLENNKAVYAALAAALVGGHRVRLFINDNDQTCVGRFIYLTQ